MRMAFYDTHKFEHPVFVEQNRNHGHELTFLETRLTETSVELARGHEGVCAFVNDCLNEAVLKSLANLGVRLIALRSAGFNNVELSAARALKLEVVRVPAYSPHAVAEHAIALFLCLNRKLHRAHNRVREGNFSLDGLVGFDLYKKTVGIIGTGKIGSVMAKIMTGFGCRVLAVDPSPNPELIQSGVVYGNLDDVLPQCDVISLHVPLNRDTHHLINERTLRLTQAGVILVNTGRGALIDTQALISSLKTGHLGGACLDVYEEEEGVFFEDLSDQILADDQLARLLTFPNVLITSHQGFLTNEALRSIAQTTLQNITDFEAGRPIANSVL